MTRTKNALFSRVFGVLVLAGAMGASGLAHADEAEAKNEEGKELSKRGEFEGARLRFLQALGLRPMAKTMLNLCVVEQQLKLEQEAIKHCRQFLTAKDADPAMVQTVQDGILRELELATGRVRFEAQPGQKIEVDGRVVGTAPLTVPIDLKAGEHECSAGGKVVKVVIKGGESVTVKLPLEGHDAAPPKETKKGSWVAPVVLAGIGVAGVGAGVVLGVLASGKATTLEDARTAGRTCAGTSDPACQDLNDALSGGKGLRTGSYIAYGVGGAALLGAVIATAVIAPWQERPAGKTARLTTVIPELEPGRAGVTVVGRF